MSAHDTDEGGPPEAASEDDELVDELLQGVRRDRPPPRLEPVVRSASGGGQAEAYAAGPRAVNARHVTPPPEDAVEIQKSVPPTIDEELQLQRRAETVVLDRAPKSATRPIVVAAMALGAGGFVVWMLRTNDSPKPTPAHLTATTELAPTAASVAPSVPPPPLPAVVASVVTPAIATSAPPPTTQPTRTAPRPRISAVSAQPIPPPSAPATTGSTGFERTF